MSDKKTVNLEIISDGTAHGTKVIDSEGRVVYGVQKITWTVDANDQLGKATIELTQIPVRVIGEALV